jgi:site-specific recombinase XerD
MNNVQTNRALTVVESVTPDLSVPEGWTDLDTIRLWLAKSDSENTLKAYKHDIGEFRAIVNKKLADVTLDDLYRYKGTLSDLAVSSLARKIAAVKSLLTFAHNQGYIRVNVGSAIDIPTVPAHLARRILPREKVDDLIGMETDPYNHALLRFLYVTGLRVNEVCTLTWQDVIPRDNGKAQVTVVGKRDKERAVLISADTYRELLSLRAKDWTKESQVFPNLYPRKAERIIEKAGKRAGLKDISPHWLRHANASHALDRGAPIHVVQQTLGHASLATTSKYTHARPSDSTGEYLGY